MQVTLSIPGNARPVASLTSRDYTDAETQNMTTVGPVTQSERITALDTVRGFALLGILLMNIVAFAMHPAAYDNPTVAGGATGANLGWWVAMHILAEGKM